MKTYAIASLLGFQKHLASKCRAEQDWDCFIVPGTITASRPEAFRLLFRQT